MLHGLQMVMVLKLRHISNIYHPGLVKLSNRFNQLIVLDHHLCQQSKLHRIWDQCIWYQAFPKGIPELTITPDMRYTPQFRFYGSIYWLSPRIVTISYFAFSIQRWSILQRTWFRLRPGTRYYGWCGDCCLTGFTYGCQFCHNRFTQKYNYNIAWSLLII